MQAALQFARERGAITSCNHPKPFGPPWEYASVTNYDCVEVWNGPWTMLNEMALEYWKGLVATGRRLTAIAGSDWHRQSQLEQTPVRAPGAPCVWVRVAGARDEAGILGAIRHGNVVLSESPDGPLVELLAGQELGAEVGDSMKRPASGRLPVRVRCHDGAGNRLLLLDQDQVLYEKTMLAEDETVNAELPCSSALYVRAEIRNEYDELKALTNPIYVE
jgi:hypothetical protein